MKGKLYFIFTLALSVLFSKVSAQGVSTITNFTLQDIVENKPVSLTTFSSQSAVVVIFTNNHCPYAKLYDDRIITLAGQYKAKGVEFILVNPTEASESLKQKVVAKGYNTYYLADEKQNVSRMLKASKTPEAFLLVPSAGKFNVVYQGAIDDNPQVPEDVRLPYLQRAIDAVLSEQKPAGKTQRATGCMIRKL